MPSFKHGSRRRNPTRRTGGVVIASGTPVTSPHFDFRAVYDIGDKTDVNQKPNVTNDYADPATSLGITHVITPIASSTVATELGNKGLKSGGWFTGNQRNTTASGSSALNSASVAVASTTGFPSSGEFYHSSGKITYTSKDGTHFLGCGNHAAISNGDPIAGFANSNSSVTTLVNNVKNTAAGSDHFYYLADEPDYTAAMAQALNGKCTAIRAADPAAVCVMADYTVISGRSQLSNWANETTVDWVYLSGAFSPIRTTAGNPGAYQSTYIPDQISKAVTAQGLRSSLRFAGIIDMHNNSYSVVAPDTAYTGTNAVIPSFPGATMAATTADNQIKEQVDDYRANAVIEGIIAFSYGPYPEQSAGVPPNGWTGWLRGGWGAANFSPRTDLIAEMAAQFLRT